jgi:hypothetical protein
MRIVKGIMTAALLAASIPAVSEAIELQQDTLNAWNDYIRNADARMQPRLDGRQAFLWTDESADRVSRVRQGEAVVDPVVGRGTQEVPNGLIHHWIGATFIPNARIDTLRAVLHDYDHYKEFYKPVVADSKMLACTPTDQEFAMTWRRRILFVSATIEGQYRAHDFAVDAQRGYTIADTTSIQEIQNYGRLGQNLLPPDNGNGYLWRLHSIARYEERDGGVYLELEAIALTRNIPLSVRWLVTPVVNHVSVSALETTLRQTRKAVNETAPGTEPLALCNGPGRNRGTATPGGME